MHIHDGTRRRLGIGFLCLGWANGMMNAVYNDTSI